MSPSLKDSGLEARFLVGLIALALVVLPAALACGPKPPAMTLLEAVDQGRADIVREHISSGADPDKAFVPPGLPAAGASALHLAVLKNDREVAQALLDNGADIDIRAKDAAQGSPLEWAAFFGIRDMVVFLAEAGADLNAKNAYGTTPLDAAYAYNPFISDKDLAKFNEDRAFVAEYLTEKGAGSGR